MKIKFSYKYDGSLPVFTECFVDYGNRRLYGWAKCNRKCDFPNKSVGRKIAFSRAVQLKDKSAKAIKIGVLDGVLYIKGDNKMYRYLVEHTEEYTILSSLLLREFIYQV